MNHIKTFESFSNPSSLDIKDIKIDDTILYQGSKYDVIENDEYTIKVKSQRTGKEIHLNQEQLNTNSARLISSAILKERRSNI